MPKASELRESLAARVSPGGGWGYVEGQLAHPEPTCLGLLALVGEAAQFAAAIESGERALRDHLAADGSYRLARGRSEATWPTALALLARVILGRNDWQPTAQRLRQLRGQVLRADPEVADMMDIDVQLVGWPWAEGNFSWVEPTAWAVLALRRCGQGDCPEVAEGLRLLVDRAFDEGGVNYGNRRVLGRLTEPIPTPTALMLLALQGLDQEPRIASALRYLRQQATTTDDLEHLCWARLAFSVWEHHPEARGATAAIDPKIAARLDASNPPHLIVRHALAILALDSDRFHPLRLSDSPCLADRRSASDSAFVNGRHQALGSTSLFRRVASRLRGVFVNGLGAMRPLPTQSAVHIASAPSYESDLVAILQNQFAHFRELVPMKGRRVVLKPNLVEYHPDKVINTDPRLIDAVIQLCRAEGASEIIVAEGPGHWRNVSYLLEESGLGAVLHRHQVPFVDLNHDEPEKLLNLGRLTGLDYLYVARTVVQTDVLISLPKLKTHHWAGATLSLKNLFGTLPGICYGWPKNELHWRGIPNSIVDIALTNTPQLAIVDGIIGMEGDGPLNGTPKHLGVVVMGTDLVAVDATCCRLMGLDPRRVPYLVLAQQKQLGRLHESEIPQLGESIAAKASPFELPPKIERMLA